MRVQRKRQPWVLFFVIILHLAVVYAIYYGIKNGFSLLSCLVAIGFFVLTIFGVTLGYHRYFTHESFSWGKAMELTVALCGGAAIEGTILSWQPNHVLHHAYTDKPDWDPHTPKQYPGLKGFLWAHVGWLFYEVVPPPGYKLSRNLNKNRIVQWQSKYYLLIALASLGLPLLLAGWDGFWLGSILRVALVLNLSWSVNSFGHKFGFRARRVDGSLIKDNESRNVPGLPLVSGGEGRHADHHRDPNAAFFATKWYHVDPGKWLLIILEFFGVVWSVNRPRKA